MLSAELKDRIDRLWDAFDAEGMSNSREVIEQITYLMFIRRLDDIETLNEAKAQWGAAPPMIFPEGDGQRLRWQRFRNEPPDVMFDIVADEVFPFLRRLGEDEASHHYHLRDARFLINGPGLLDRAVEMVSALPLAERGTAGELYEYMIGKGGDSWKKGQFPTPRHIIRLMVELTAPTPNDRICDPACGTAGFLVESAAHVQGEHSGKLLAFDLREHFDHDMFHGRDVEPTMLRTGVMNMLLHSVGAPDIRYRNSLAEGNGGTEDEEGYSLVLANPPFSGGLNHETVAGDLRKVVATKKTELLFLARALRLLKPGGRAAIIVPDGVLFGTGRDQRAIRRLLVEDQRLDGVVKLPSRAFSPHNKVSTAILFFTRTDSGGTDYVWFYDVQADGRSLDDRRSPLLPEDKLGVWPEAGALTEEEHACNNLPDVLARWRDRAGGERRRERTEQSFCVPKADIVANDYDLSLNRYKKPVYDEVERRAPQEIIAEIRAVDALIREGVDELDALLG